MLDRLRRIQGQVRGLQRMVSEDQYCTDVLTEVSPASRALQGSLVDEQSPAAPLPLIQTPARAEVVDHTK